MGKERKSLTGVDAMLMLDERGRVALALLRENGVCQSYPLEIFFPRKGKPATDAKAVCATCSVRVECLAFSLEHFEREGVWGQTNERDRRPLMRRMRAGESPGALAAEYHAAPRPQCIAVTARTGERCRILAARNSEVCGYHEKWARQTAGAA